MKYIFEFCTILLDKPISLVYRAPLIMFNIAHRAGQNCSKGFSAFRECILCKVIFLLSLSNLLALQSAHNSISTIPPFTIGRTISPLDFATEGVYGLCI